jgi:hypothetical protein
LPVGRSKGGDVEYKFLAKPAAVKGMGVTARASYIF